MISYTQKDKYTLHIKVPYALREEFKREFRDAIWNPDIKAWRLFSNAVIMERLDQFISIMTKPAANAAKLETLEYTYAEIKAVELRSIQLNDHIMAELEKLEPQEAVIARLAEVNDAFHTKGQAFKARVAEANARLRKFEKDINEIIEPLGVIQDIDCLIQAWARYSGGMGYYGVSELMSDFREAQESLKDSYSDILEHFGIGLDTLLELASLNWDDRRGPQPNVIAKDLYRKISYASINEVATA